MFQLLHVHLGVVTATTTGKWTTTVVLKQSALGQQRIAALAILVYCTCLLFVGLHSWLNATYC